MSHNVITNQAAQLYGDSLVWDNHCCFPNPIAGKEVIFADLRRYRDSGVRMLSVNIGDAEVTLENHIVDWQRR